MRRLWILGWLFAAALAQGLVLPEGAVAGRPVELAAQGLEPGAYPIEIAGPGGTEVVTLVTTENGGRLAWTPEAPGRYLLTLFAPGAKYRAELEVAPPPPPVTLEADGLRIGSRTWPLPPGDWLAPLETPDAVYLAQRGAPLVLAFPRGGEREPLYAFYPYLPVEELREGPAVSLQGGGVWPLAGLPADRPYAGAWSTLEPLHVLAQFWRDQGVASRLPAGPGGYRPYWSFLAEDPALLDERDLAAWGRDLLRRGHRPELVWGEGARAWSDRWQAAARRGDEATARRLAEALLRYAPLHPGAAAFFGEMADRFAAAGDPAAALRLRTLARQAEAQLPVLRANGLERALAALALAYLALVLVLGVRYLPAQRRSLADWGGLWGSWVRNPLRRFRYLLFAHAGWGERLLAALLFFAAAAVLWLWGGVRGFEAETARPPFDRATLVGASFENWPAGPERAALQAYAALPGEAADPRAFEGAAPLAFVEALRYRLSGDPQALLAAYRAEAVYPPLRAALGLGDDAWSEVYRAAGVERMGTPRARDLCRAYLIGSLRQLTVRPTRSLEALGWSSGAAWALLVALAAWALLHLWVLLLPRPRGTVRAAGTVARAFELIVPGSTSFGKGWGVVLLLAAAYGAVRWILGDPTGGGLWLAAAYLPHLVLWYGEVHR
ncbi:hypothetical protein [Oceanithermus sp.]|uniref:hypothetical protein n=1 Tax=Oceanithermus sp. TaxID=2268145 RepID=UPI00257BDD7E|nr:hypothetical protein [Oceanithermus sp.]